MPNGPMAMFGFRLSGTYNVDGGAEAAMKTGSEPVKGQFQCRKTFYPDVFAATLLHNTPFIDYGLREPAPELVQGSVARSEKHCRILV